MRKAAVVQFPTTAHPTGEDAKCRLGIFAMLTASKQDCFQPLLRRHKLRIRQPVTGILPVGRNLGARLFKQFSQPLAITCRDNRIVSSRLHQNVLSINRWA